MRTKLKALENERLKFTGIFERFGIKSGWQGSEETTILLKDIKNEKNKIVSEHCWFNYTKGFQKLELKNKVKVEFYARVTPYIKGYVNNRDFIDNREIDYRLSHPTKIKIIN